MGYILPHSDLFLSQDLILSWGRCSVCISVFISAFICFIKKKAPAAYLGIYLALLCALMTQLCAI